MRWLILPAILLVTALAAACGGGGGSSSYGSDDEAAIRKVVIDFSDALNKGDAGKAYSLFDAKSHQSCKESDFKMLVQLLKAFAGNDKLGVAEVRDIRVTGDRAKANVVATLGKEKQDADEQEFVKEGGKWKLVMEAGECGPA